MITRYRTRNWTFDVEEMTFVSETPSFCIDENGRRHGKKTAHDMLHKSKDEAISHMRNIINEKIETAKERVLYLEKELSEFNKIYPL